MKLKIGIWVLLMCQTLAIMDSELHYVSSKEKKSSLGKPAVPPSVSTSSSPFLERNPFLHLIIQHFYMKKSSTLSSASQNKIFYDKTTESHGSGDSHTSLNNVLTIQPSLSLTNNEENENFKEKEKADSLLLPQEESELKIPDSQSSASLGEVREEEGDVSQNKTTSESPSTGIPEEEEVVVVVELDEQKEEESGDDDTALNTTEIEVPKIENKTEDIPSFSSWNLCLIIGVGPNSEVFL